MRKLHLPLLLAVLAFTAAFARSDDWTKTYDLMGKPDLRVEATDASIKVESWDQNKIEAHVRIRGWHIGNGDLEIVESQQGNAVTLELRHPRHGDVSFGIDTRRPSPRFTCRATPRLMSAA